MDRVKCDDELGDDHYLKEGGGWTSSEDSDVKQEVDNTRR